MTLSVALVIVASLFNVCGAVLNYIWARRLSRMARVLMLAHGLYRVMESDR